VQERPRCRRGAGEGQADPLVEQIRGMRQPDKWQAGELYVQELNGSAGQEHFPVPLDPTGPPVPELAATELGFTDATMISAQYLDEAYFEALLTGSEGDPIEGQTLTFILTGEESSRAFEAITGEHGNASATPTLIEKPGPYQLTARYDGDESRAPSAVTRSFVVEKKDTDLELTVEGSGQNMSLRARLAHRDAKWKHVVGRTIDFYSDGDVIGSGITDEEGIASVEVPPGHRGANRTYEALFEGDDFYAPSSDRRLGRGGGQGDGGGTMYQAARSYRGGVLLL
jgi:hypothetical protein